MRLYRGIGENKPLFGEEHLSGRWFTDDLEVARTYGPRILYVDLPPKFAKMYQLEGKPDHEYCLPEAWVYQALELRDERPSSLLD